MKLEYTYDDSKQLFLTIFALFMVMIIPFIMIYLMNGNTYNDSFFMMLAIFTITIVLGSIRNSRKKRANEIAMTDGFKIQGYITGVSKHRSTKRSCNYIYCINVIFNNKTYVVQDLKNNAAYKKLENTLSNNYQPTGNGQFNFTPLTIDIYIKDDVFYADLDSVNLN